MILRHTMEKAVKPILYGDEASPPVRFAMMTASLANIDIEFKKIDLFKGENRTEFYKKINPFQKVPSLSVNGQNICDSHAIALYFCRKSNNQDLYPDDIILRAKIDEWLYFDAGILFPIDSAIFSDLFAGKWPANEVLINKWYSALDHCELLLAKQKWLTGDKIRLCDICCGTTISSLEILVPLLDRHERLKDWMKELKNLPCFEINTQGLKRLQGFVDAMKPVIHK
ncbi:glutathione S-transferase 1 isoform X2 [Spodoptera frugiperda]|uniref:Glutathione S-transferase 1 isoform X2 n=1 Tax=Spodoptera frugiperda TaxID=7108 RepID=A0A9R0DPB6_SPOFR|nr:glutathione S-transferase 1 isoform X2 [Spodoptera frugiperda]